MSDEKYLFKIQKDNEDSKIVETKTDMIFYNFNCRENFPISINYSNLNLLNKNKNELQLKKINEKENNEKKQNLNLFEFFELLKRKRNAISKSEKQENEILKKNTNKLSDQESLHSNYSSGININDSTKSNELIEKNESIENLILQFSSSRDEQNKNKIIKKLLVSKKKLHKEKLENFYKIIALHLKEKIENVREWVSLEDRFNKIDNLSNNICRELAKYIKVHQEGKFQSDNNTSKDFLRVHFVDSIKVKMIDLRSILKRYR